MASMGRGVEVHLRFYFVDSLSSESHGKPTCPPEDGRGTTKSATTMATTRPPNLSNILHRVASTCLSSPCNGQPLRHHLLLSSPDSDPPPPQHQEPRPQPEETYSSRIPTLATDSDELMEEVFEAVGAMKRAYARLQEAHSPWDPDKMRSADAAVIAELRKLARLKDRYRRGKAAGRAVATPLPLSEAVAPYEAALDEARKEIKVKEAEVQGLRDRIRSAPTVPPRRKGREASRRKVSSSAITDPGSPTAELFGRGVSELKSASKSFTRHFLSLIRASYPDTSAALRSVTDGPHPPITAPHHAKHGLSSYIHRHLFQGFEDESFYMEGSLSSLLDPAQHRRDCYAQFRDMRSMDPAELLGVLPTCAFGKWAAKKFRAIVTPDLEALLSKSGSVGISEQRKAVERGVHPRTGFYGEYLRLAKAVWMLHLLAFALDPPPSHFEAAQGSEYQAEHMESVVRFPGGGVPSGWVVGFSVAPGFKLGNGSVVRARVYPVPRAKD